MSVKKYFAATAILVGGAHHDAGDEVKTNKDEAEALVRLGRVHNDEEKAKAARDARAAAAKAAEKPAA